MRTRSFVARMPNEPGALHRGAEVVKGHGGNIDRVHYDRRIDPHTVFFEVTCGDGEYEAMMADLDSLGYLRDSLSEPAFLRFEVTLPDSPGSLLELLRHITASGSNIAFLDFDAAQGKDTLSVGLTVEDSSRADGLLRSIRSLYPLEIMEHATTGEQLDDTVLYLRFVQDLRALVPHMEESMLLEMLPDINHMVQSLHRLERDPRKVFASVLEMARALRDTTEDFRPEIQRIPLPGGWELICIQPPCGGNVFLLKGEGGTLMVDSGYGVYHRRIMEAMRREGIDLGDIEAILLTHADADHSGGAGYLDRPTYLSRGTEEIMFRSNRAHGSRSEASVLENVYTRLIDTFSLLRPPERKVIIDDEGEGMRVVGRMRLLGLDVEAIASLGGHQRGLLMYRFPGLGLLFTADCLINFDSLSEGRRRYNMLAKVLMTTVNVDSDLARREREEVLSLARKMEAGEGRPLICGGHGAVSVLEGERLIAVPDRG